MHTGSTWSSLEGRKQDWWHHWYSWTFSTIHSSCRRWWQPIFFGGDQLTRERAIHAQKRNVQSKTSLGRLQGIIPKCEDALPEWNEATKLFWAYTLEARKLLLAYQLTAWRLDFAWRHKYSTSQWVQSYKPSHRLGGHFLESRLIYMYCLPQYQ